MSHIDQKHRTEKLRRDIAAIQKRQDAKPATKPAVRIPVQPVGFNRTDFGELAFSRMDRQRSIMAEVRSPNWMKESLSPKQQWDRAVEEIMLKETAGDKSAALKIASKRFRGILNQMRIAANR